MPVNDNPALVMKYNARQFARLQRDLKGLPKEASRELRKESKQIASQVMKPELDRQLRQVPIWGPRMADRNTVWVVSDRIPKVKIGQRAKKPIFSGGATGIYLRHPTATGRAKDSFAPFQAVRWMRKASKNYKDETFTRWAEVVEKICRKFNADRGGYV